MNDIYELRNRYWHEWENMMISRIMQGFSKHDAKQSADSQLKEKYAEEWDDICNCATFED